MHPVRCLLVLLLQHRAVSSNLSLQELRFPPLPEKNIHPTSMQGKQECVSQPSLLVLRDSSQRGRNFTALWLALVQMHGALSP